MRCLYLLIFTLLFSQPLFSACLQKIVFSSGAFFKKDVPYLECYREELEWDYCGREITCDLIQEIKKKVLIYSEKNGHCLITVIIPEQDVSYGIVRFEVKESVAGKICFSGNKWFNSDRLRNRICINEGETISEPRISSDVAFLNRNPFRYTHAEFSPGACRGTTDVNFVTEDRFPIRVYGGADNYGTEFTGKAHYFGGITWGNVWGSGDILSYQFTTSKDYEQFHSHFASYTSYLPWKNILMLFGGFAEIHPKIKGFHSEGKNAQGSLRYTIPFAPFYRNFQHEITIGADYKNLNSNLFFIGELELVPVSSHAINLTQAYFCYHLQNRQDYRHQTTLKIEVFASPVQFLPHQDDSSYHQLRLNSSPKYYYSRAYLGQVHEWCAMGLAWLLRGQGASGPLISSEQMNLAGNDAVRGYEELAFIADNGVIANLELRTPKCLFWRKKAELYFIAFADYGWGRNDRATLGLPIAESLYSVGPGLRFQVDPNMILRADYGFQLRDIPGDHGFGRFHLSALLSF